MTPTEGLVVGMIWGALNLRLEEHGIRATPLVDGEGNYSAEIVVRFPSGTELLVTVTETRSADARGCKVVAGNATSARRRDRA